MDKKKIDNNKNEKDNQVKRLRTLKSIMVLLDVFAAIILILQIITKSVSYSSLAVLIICNIIVFLVKPNKE